MQTNDATLYALDEERDELVPVPFASRLICGEDNDLPDFDMAYLAKRIEGAEMKRGRPKANVTKISTTIRLDPDVIEAFRAEGPGWQERMNAALCQAAGL